LVGLVELALQNALQAVFLLLPLAQLLQFGAHLLVALLEAAQQRLRLAHACLQVHVQRPVPLHLAVALQNRVELRDLYARVVQLEQRVLQRAVLQLVYPEFRFVV